MRRRAFLASTVALAACRPAAVVAPPRPVVAPKRAGVPPRLPLGVQIGDVSEDRAVIWSRADRRAQLRVAWSHEGKEHVEVGPTVDADTDFCGVLELAGLPRGATLKYA